MSLSNDVVFKITLLGRFEILRKNKPIPQQAWPQRKTQSLLKLLVSHRGQVFTQDQLIETFFQGIVSSKTSKNLHSRISEVRRVLDPSHRRGKSSLFIIRAGQGYCFSKEAPCWIDVEQLQLHEKQARQFEILKQWPQACDQYQRAVELYQGDYLLEDLYEEWTIPPRQHWQERYLFILEQLAKCYAHLNEISQAIECCKQALVRDPYRESLYRQKMHFHQTMGDYGQALQTYQACVEALQDLDVEPSQEMRALASKIRQNKAAVKNIVPNNLPHPTNRFIGRNQELKYIKKCLNNPNCRLLTLIGIGGVGKTRLALQAAKDYLSLEQYPDGLFFIPLTGVSSTEFFLSAISDALKLEFLGQEDLKVQLLNYFRKKEMLLLLDNFEHLLEQVVFLDELLTEAPKINLLITSRARLNLNSEWLLEVNGLTFPTAEKTDDFTRFEAVKLFLERASQVHFDAFDTKDMLNIARICALVEGLPLGIEITATWVRSFSCKQIIQELEKGLDSLTSNFQDIPKRHQSIRAVFEHSWALLSDEEKLLFSQLSVFQGGFQDEAITFVTGARLSLLRELLDKSLIRKSDSGRYEIHELLRQFAEEKLKQNTKIEEQTRNHHCSYYEKYLLFREPSLRGKKRKKVISEIQMEIENILLSWHWALKKKKLVWFDTVLECLYQFFIHGRFQEGNHLFGQTIKTLSKKGDLTKREKITSLLLEKLMARRGFFLLRLGLYQEAKRILKNSLKIPSATKKEKAFPLRLLGHIYRLQRNYVKAKLLFQESLEISQTFNIPYEIQGGFTGLGIISAHAGKYDEAIRYHQASLIIAQEISDQEGIAAVLNNLGEVARYQGRYTHAKQLYQNSLDIEIKINHQWGMAISLKNLSLVAINLGEYLEANRLCQKTLVIETKLGDRWAISRTLGQLGNIAYYLKKYEESIEFLQKSLDIAKEIKDRWTAAMSLIYLGQVTLKLRKLSESQQHFQESLDICQEIDEPLGISESLTGLGLVSLGFGKHETAQDQLRKALKTAMDIQASPAVLNALCGLAVLFIKTEKLEWALKLAGFIVNHPVSTKDNRTRAENLMLQLKSALSSKTVETNLKRGKALTLKSIAQQIEKQLK